MAEIISFSPDGLDAKGHFYSYLMEGIYLNLDDKIFRYAYPKLYEYADIHIGKINPSEVSPTAKYVLRSHLATIEALDKELSAEGIDIFNLEGIVKIDNNNFICPPILEVWKEEPYNGKPVIVDGAHRLYIARKRGIDVTCAIISGKISSMLPVLPLASWNEVIERDTVPEDKRNYHPGIPTRFKPHELYRQKFPGSTGPRIVLDEAQK